MLLYCAGAGAGTNAGASWGSGTGATEGCLPLGYIKGGNAAYC